MSTALAIAGVTQLLRDVLNDGIVNTDLAASLGESVLVHARPPDRAKEAADKDSVLNVFLYKVDNQGNWSNHLMPTRTSSGDRANNTPLTLDLYYLVSAITTKDLHGDILLGHAMQILHEHPGFDRAEIQTGLSAPDTVSGILPAALKALTDTGLAEQVEQLVLSPHYLSDEEMSKLWATFQTSYRPSMAYRVSPVIIQARAPERTALPVLSLGPSDEAPAVSVGLAVPELASITFPSALPSARPGDRLILRGKRLDGPEVRVRFENPRIGDIAVAPEAGGSGDTLAVTIPDVPDEWVAGLYHLSVSTRGATGQPARSTNRLAFQLSPIPDLQSAQTKVSRLGDGGLKIEMEMRPQIQREQRVELILGDTLVEAQPRPGKTSNATFLLPDLPADTYRVRLRVDGVQSWLINEDNPEEFDSSIAIEAP